jgi:glutathione S-transferase
MADLKIIGAPQSNYVWAVRMVCEEKGVPYDLVDVRPHSPEVDAIHPFGKIPVMRHKELELCESKAIATYVDRTFGGPKLFPDDPRREALVEQWVSLVNTTTDPLMVRVYLLNYVFSKGKDGQPDRATIDAAVPTLQKQIGILDAAVVKTGYLVGDQYTFADINVLPILFYVNRFPEAALHSNRPRLSDRISSDTAGARASRRLCRRHLLHAEFKAFSASRNANAAKKFRVRALFSKININGNN